MEKAEKRQTGVWLRKKAGGDKGTFSETCTVMSSRGIARQKP